jgi:hypothetical protein
MFPKSLVLALGLALAASWSVAQEEEKILNVYNWSDYIAEDTIRNFEKETGIKVRYDNFDNNEIVHAKLVAGKTGYDIVMPSSNWAKLQADGGLLRKLDKAQLPNLKNLDPPCRRNWRGWTPATNSWSTGCGASRPWASTSRRSRPRWAARPCPTTSGTWSSSPSTSASSRAAA